MGLNTKQFEVQMYDEDSNTIYYEMVTDALDYDSARDKMKKKYPYRRVVMVRKK